MIFGREGISEVDYPSANRMNSLPLNYRNRAFLGWLDQILKQIKNQQLGMVGIKKDTLKVLKHRAFY